MEMNQVVNVKFPGMEKNGVSSCPPQPSKKNQGHSSESGIRKRGFKVTDHPFVGTMATVPLPYTIHASSSHSGTYFPQHIMENKPLEQASRWSSGTHDQDQFLTLRFPSPVIARTIVFGKFHRAHVCNLKEFKLFGGYSDTNLVELLHTGLKNDTEQETFDLRIHCQQLILPIQYLKIVPLSTFGANFNYSIWFVQVHGIQDGSLLEQVVSQYHQYQEIQTTRLCLKHFRQRNMMPLFRLLQERTAVELEHPLITQLHAQLVLQGDFAGTERLLEQLLEEGIFQHHVKHAPYKAQWRRIWATNQDGDVPCPRGGHQMCIDVTGRLIYLLGGWNGQQDLADFWCYDIQADQWKLICVDTSLHGGPSPRSCHKICFDSKSRSIFVLGKYMECQSDQRLESDFYRYYCDYNKWVKISDNTALEKGPKLIFDHQMCIDEQGEMIYIFGGRNVTYESTTTMYTYSGLYGYNIATNVWRLIRADGGTESSPTPAVTTTTTTSTDTIKSRVGHSMLLDPVSRQLYIFAGQRVKLYLSDLFTYAIDTNTLTEISQDYAKESGGPDAGYTQRATMDTARKEIYVLSGYLRNQGCDVVKSGLWVYAMDHNQWTKVYQNENRDPEYWQKMKHVEPCPRFAHQMVYDPKAGVQYVFGGNPGDRECASKRLDDFWQLKLTRPDPDDILRRSIYLVRTQQLREMCMNGPSDTIGTLDYLQTKLTPLVNHDNQDEVNHFRQLCTRLCLSSENNACGGGPGEKDGKGDQDLFAERNQVFDALLEFIPDEMKEPVGQLLDSVKLV